MRYISDLLRKAVIARAVNRCEYCGLSQAGQEAKFHIDHIIPVVAGGETTTENLALACVSCSLRKGACQVATDPDTNQSASIFNPRTQKWGNHFCWEGVRVIGLTPTGRATVALLKMNRPIVLAIRREETVFNRHPP